MQVNEIGSEVEVIAYLSGLPLLQGGLVRCQEWMEQVQSGKAPERVVAGDHAEVRI